MATIDATNMLLGRLASYIAKKALLGEAIDVVNCEKAAISGDRYMVRARYTHKRTRGTYKGPFISKLPSNLVRRTVRGMLPYKTSHGEEAFKRVKCHIGVPEKITDKKFQTVAGANISKLPNYKYTTVGYVCKHLGWKA